ncbi:MAG: uracil-DNA glycosylase family protein [Coriobacteriales bacterium]|jgi:hypothetical protein|nr:uracil-DNA glycosylase family protein [Coriobacteriales bacterium]
MDIANQNEQSLDALRLQLHPYSAYLAGQPTADVLIIKGQPGPAELAGDAAFSGRDAIAIEAALNALGWGKSNWCGVILALPGEPGLSPEQLRWVIEINDPTQIIVLDKTAQPCVSAALSIGTVDLLDIKGLQSGIQSSDQNEAQVTTQAASAKPQKTNLKLGEQVFIMGRHVLVVDDFESSLDDDIAKQRVWAQLKLASTDR